MRTVILLLLFAVVTFADDKLKFSTDVSKWVEVPFKKYDSPDYRKLLENGGWSNHSWTVSIENKKVAVSKSVKQQNIGDPPKFSLNSSDVPFRIKDYVRCTIQIEDGWLVSYNAGEFGKALWWFSKDGAQNRQVSDHQVNQFISTKVGIFAVEGSAHGIDNGSVIQINKEDKKWVAKLFASLPNAGRAATTLPNNELLILTDDAILRISEKGKIETLIDKLGWGSLYPNSIVMKNEKMMYIGMRQYVAEYNLDNKEQIAKLLVPSIEFLKNEKNK